MTSNLTYFLPPWMKYKSIEYELADHKWSEVDFKHTAIV